METRQDFTQRSYLIHYSWLALRNKQRERRVTKITVVLNEKDASTSYTSYILAEPISQLCVRVWVFAFHRPCLLCRCSLFAQQLLWIHHLLRNTRPTAFNNNGCLLAYCTPASTLNSSITSVFFTCNYSLAEW